MKQLSLTQKHRVEKQVYFIAKTPDILSFYQVSHTVVVPSYSEGFSLVCAEAMACACNVLASRDVGIHSEIINKKRTGYLFDIQEKTELKQLLADLFSGKVKHLGKEASLEIEKKWSSKLETENLMDLYKNAILRAKKKNRRIN